MSQSQIHFSNTLRTLRVTNRLTQSEMAEKLGVCRSTYSYYEIGRTQPDIEKLVSICHILNVSSDSLLGIA